MARNTSDKRTRVQQGILGIAVTLIFLGTVVFAWGYRMPRYHDKRAYERRYHALDGPTRSADFYALRAEFLTASYRLQDYGLTAVLLGCVLLPVSRSRKISGLFPKRKFTVGLLGCAAAWLVYRAEVASLYLDMSRDEFPHWADSIAIPLGGMYIISAALVPWAIVHSFFTPSTQGQFQRLKFSVVNCWLALLISVTLAFLLIVVGDGYFWQVIPCALWIAFYLSIWIKRSETLGAVDTHSGPETTSEI